LTYLMVYLGVADLVDSIVFCVNAATQDESNTVSSTSMTQLSYFIDIIVFATPPVGAAPMASFADLPRAPKLEQPRRVRRLETLLERSLSGLP
jgi:hypothetical protein